MDIKRKHVIPIISATFLHIVFLLIVLNNMTFGKNLIGWDAINPEFNFFINFRRVFSAFWQENQGVGLLAGHGFAAVLPHNIIIFFLALLAPKEILRTIFTFLCFYVGGIGIYVFMQHILHHYILKNRDGLKNIIPLLALVATLHYWVNLGTVQMFFIQLEAFIFHFAALPWLFYVALLLCERVTKKRLILFVFVNFFATTQGFIPPLFVAYAFGLGIFLLGFVIANKFAIKSIKKTVLIVLLTAFLNSYWLIPLGYYTLTRSSIYLNSYNNFVSTPEFINKNKKYGDLKNVALIRGFMFEAVDSSTENSITYVLQPWVTHTNKPVVQVLGYIFFGVIVIGIASSLFLFISWVGRALAGVFFFFFTGITTDFFPFSLFTSFLQNYMPVYRQAFRAAFTKFALGVAFSYSIFFCIGITAIFILIHRYIKSKYILKSALFGVVILLLYFGLPYFTGDFFYYRLKVKIPTSYLNMIEYFKTQPDGRIADFPQDCPEGWYTYDWNYTGSGFYWYAIRQPIMSRTFDVWSNYNENYYWEITQALREKNYLQAEKILDKYDVKWILYDENTKHCRNQKAFLYNEPFLTYLQSSVNYRIDKTFTSMGSKPVYIFTRTKNNASNSFIEVSNSLMNIGPTYKWTDNDSALLSQEKYTSIKGKPYDLYYPFRSLFSKRKAEENEEKVMDDGKNIIVQSLLPPSVRGYSITVPSISSTEKIIPVQLILKNVKNTNNYLISLIITRPTISVDATILSGNSKEISMGKIAFQKLEDASFQSNGVKIAFNANMTAQTVLYSDFTNTISAVDSKSNKLLFSWSSDTPEFSNLVSQSSTIALPQFFNGVIQAVIPELLTNESEFIYKSSIKQIEPKPCNELQPNNRNSYNLDVEGSTEYLRVFSQNSRQCMIFNLPNFPMNLGYLVKVNARKIEGSNPVFYISDAESHHFIDVFLYEGNSFESKYMILPPSIKNGVGYDIYFDNLSQNNYPTINDFASLEVSPIPYNYLKQITIEKTSTINVVVPQDQQIPQSGVSVEHPLETYYSITIKNGVTSPKNLLLFQSFDLGWKAYEMSEKPNWIGANFPFLFGKELKEHVLINNWANGWKISPAIAGQLNQLEPVKPAPTDSTDSTLRQAQGKTHIVIVFLPQYLQYIGFGLLIGTFVGIVVWKS